MVDHVATAGFHVLMKVGSTLWNGTSYVSAPAMGIKLEPMATMISLCTLCYRAKGTKLYINASGISYDEPGNKSKLTRRLTFASRDDLPVLCSAVEQFSMAYNHKHAHIRFICNGAIRGLKELSTCYDKDESGMTIVHCLQLYQDKIRAFLDQDNVDVKIEKKRMIVDNTETPASSPTTNFEPGSISAISSPIAVPQGKKKKHKDHHQTPQNSQQTPLGSSNVPIGMSPLVLEPSASLTSHISLYQLEHKDNVKFSKWTADRIQIVILILQQLESLSALIPTESGGFEPRTRQQQYQIDEWLRAIDIILPISHVDE
jgi:hypothetical protein